MQSGNLEIRFSSLPGLDFAVAAVAVCLVTFLD